MNIKVSIIVPVYKSEKFIQRCIASLLIQTLRDIEIILVDDGSPDHSGDICDQYGIEDTRVKVIHKENGGPSSARNVGIREAKGKYISFVDSDDYVENDFCEAMYSVAAKFDVDVVNCDYYRESIKVEKEVSQFEKNVMIDNKEILQYLKRAHETTIVWFACRNIYKRSIIINHNIFFNEEIRFGEDPVFNLYAFYYAKSLYSIDKCLYHYVATPDSLTQEQYKENLLEKFIAQYKAKNAFYEMANLVENEYKEDYCRNNIEHALLMLLTNVYHGPHQDCLGQLRRIRKSDFIRLSFENYKASSKLSRKMQFLLYLFQNNIFFLVHLLCKMKMRMDVR